MRDLATELRNYVDRFDEPFDPAALIEKAETVTVTSPPPRPSLRRGVLISFAAAIIVLILVGGALLIGGPFSGDETPVGNQPNPETTVTQPPPETTVPTTPPSTTATTVVPPLVETTPAPSEPDAGLTGNRITVWTDGVDYTSEGPTLVEKETVAVTFTRPSGPPHVPFLAVVGLADGATLADFFAEAETNGLGLEQLEGFLQPEAQAHWDWQPPAWMVYGNIVDPLGISLPGSFESCACTWDGLVPGEYHLFIADPRQPLVESAVMQAGTFEVRDLSSGR